MTGVLRFRLHFLLCCTEMRDLSLLFRLLPASAVVRVACLCKERMSVVKGYPSVFAPRAIGFAAELTASSSGSGLRRAKRSPGANTAPPSG